MEASFNTSAIPYKLKAVQRALGFTNGRFVRNPIMYREDTAYLVVSFDNVPDKYNVFSAMVEIINQRYF